MARIVLQIEDEIQRREFAYNTPGKTLASYALCVTVSLRQLFN